MTKIAINGFGRIGRAFFKKSLAHKELEVVAVNDLGDVANLAYLLRHDTAYGPSGLEIVAADGMLIVNGKKIKVFAEKDPTTLPWKDLDIDVVVESTGFFTNAPDAKKHLDAGAKRVVITAPMKGEAEGVESGTVLMGINEDKLETCQITSNASCTTNAASPVIQVLHETIGIEKAILNTVHAYTQSQSIQDGPNKKDWREGRAAAANIVPTSTGAAIAVTKAITDLEGKFDGISIRVPVTVGSIADVTFITKRDTTVEEVNDILRKAAGEKRWEGILKVTDEELVSSDIIGEPFGAIVDSKLTRVVGGNLVKVLSWYDNEGGYTHTLVEHVRRMAKFL